MLTLEQRSKVSALRAAARGLRIAARLGVADWAAKHRRLSAKSSAMPGPWLPSRIPYLNAIMDALDPRHPAKQVTFCKSAQTGGSECGLNWIGWVIDQAPGPMLVLMPTEKLGLRWVRGRLRPMILESRVLNGKLRLGRQSKANGATLTELHFPGGVIYLGSANVPSDLSSVPVMYLLLDEVDRMPRVIDGEGNPVELAKRRLATYQGRSKSFGISTPTDDGSPIAKDYAESSRGRFWVPCPHCSEFQTLKWEQITYPDGQPREARYRCEHHGCVIEESSKTAMLARGEWRHERPELVAHHAGFHVNCLYAPTGLGDSWADNAVAYEAAKQDPAKRQVFRNTRLGEIDIGGKVRVDWETTKLRAEQYAVRTIPKGVLALTAGVDVQVDRFEVQVLGWSPGERAAVIDYRVIEGEPTNPDDWKALDHFLEQPIVNAFGVPMRVECAMVDAANWQHEVLNFTRPLRARGIFASRGSPVLTRPPIGRPSFPDVRKRKGKEIPDQRRGARMYLLGVGELKKIIYARLKADAGQAAREDDAPENTTPGTRFIRFPAGLPDEYYRQLVAEEFDPLLRRWIALRERNEAGDTMVYGFAAALHESVAVHRWREADIARLLQIYEPAEVSKTTEPGPGSSGSAIAKWSRN